MDARTPADVAAVVCTLNSMPGIEQCLSSLRVSGVGEIVVVDGGSRDGTREAAERYADQFVTDPGTGLGYARNMGIARTSAPLILNLGSDNVLTPGALQRMIDSLLQGAYQGVSARTLIEGRDYPSRGLNAWRQGRFVPGPAAVIGTPTLFDGNLLRAHPYDPTRRFSDDSELCERWVRDFGARFAISDAIVLEVGKATWDEIVVRCRMYGISDEEVFREGRRSGWSHERQLRSLLHPLRADLLIPIGRLPVPQAIASAPFLAAFTGMRYAFWVQTAFRRR